ncbi:M20 family peptidase [Ramlibacter sp. G-1-2-2]|uniref:M20 family peptidase n=1 Tax=Ramlibacter agri TaxID=2728837 RepID=A0A848HFV1_9BURK|nr:M20 family peptidase [Ramlibacter agri]NML48319.1 M20 family peptidase [Ramlibacter agri]
MLKRIFLALAAVVLLLVAALAINTLRQGSRQLQVPAAAPFAIDRAALADKLAGAIRIRTVSGPDEKRADPARFQELHAYLAQRFPLVHARLKREEVDGVHLLYTWPGTDPSAKGIALMAHQDVVPIAPGTEGQWQQPPFDGVVKDGYVWGRGTWDDKGNLVAELEAVEQLLAAGFQPRQTVYIVSGADEELGGDGARKIAQLLQDRKVRLEFVIDEGLVLTHGIFPGVQAPVAPIGVAEKGYMSVELKAKSAPGHSSMPPPAGTGSIAQVSAALSRLDTQQMPASMNGVAREMFETLAPEMSGLQRVALSNLWLFGPVVQAQMERSGSMNSTLRTTTALTMVHAGNKDNVLPPDATGTVNFRILPGDTRESVLAHVREVAGPGIAVRELPSSYDPTPVTPTASTGYQAVNRAVRAVFPGTVVVPALYVAGSDSRSFVPIADNIFRFCPVRAGPEDLSRLHGTNERISVQNLAELAQFYQQLLRNLNAPAP